MELTALLAIARLLVGGPQPGVPVPLVSVARGASISCAAVDQRAMRRCARLKGVHLAECVNLATGEVLGAVLTKAGRVRCQVTGSVFTDVSGDTCAQVSVCGATATACLNDPSTLGVLRCLGLV